MIDLYLKFTNEAEAASILYTLHPEVVEEDGITITEAYTTPNYQNIDTLGIIYKQPPEDAGEDYVPVPEEGWHVNVRVVGDEDPVPLEQYAVHPTVPRRVWG
jgi:hypothetical protein